MVKVALIIFSNRCFTRWRKKGNRDYDFHDNDSIPLRKILNLLFSFLITILLLDSNIFSMNLILTKRK